MRKLLQLAMLAMFSLFVNIGMATTYYAILTPNAGADIIVCPGMTARLNGSISGTSGPTTYYKWNIISGSATLSSNLVVNPTVLGLNPGQTAVFEFETGDYTLPSAKKTDQVLVTMKTTNELVSNGNFEAGIAPNAQCQTENATDWSRATGTPDLFDKAAPTCINPLSVSCDIAGMSDNDCVNIPCNHFGFQNAISGESRYTGLWAAVGIFNKYYPKQSMVAIEEVNEWYDPQFLVEAIKTELLQPLTIGKTYEFSIWVSHGQRGKLLETATFLPKSLFNLKLSEIKPYQTGTTQFAPVEYGDIIATKETAKVGGWEQITFTFKPKKAYKWLIIESTLKKTGAAQDVATYVRDLLANNTVPAFESYMFVDKVSLKEYCDPGCPSCAIVAHDHPEIADLAEYASLASGVSEQNGFESSSFKVYPNPNQGEFTIDYLLSNSGTAKLEIHDLNGRTVFNTDLSKQGGTTGVNNLENGIYTVRLIQDGKTVQNTKLVVIR